MLRSTEKKQKLTWGFMLWWHDPMSSSVSKAGLLVVCGLTYKATTTA